jgi:hypothetical protein
MNMLMDPVYTIRETALQSLIDISKSIHNNDWLMRTCSAKI